MVITAVARVTYVADYALSRTTMLGEAMRRPIVGYREYPASHDIVYILTASAQSWTQVPSACISI